MNEGNQVRPLATHSDRSLRPSRIAGPPSAQRIDNRSMPPSSENIVNLHIDRLTLSGLTHADPKAVAASLRRSLIRLTRERTDLNWSNLQHSDTGGRSGKAVNAVIRADASPDQIGLLLAQTILRRVFPGASTDWTTEDDP